MTGKMISTLLASLFAASAFALRPGDPVQELAPVKWLQGAPLALLPPEKPQPTDPKLKAVVFLLTRAANVDETLTLLNYLRRTFAGEVRLAVVTPDSEADAKALLAKHPDFTLSFGQDTQRTVTPRYMAGSMLYPMAFVVDRKGNIIWSGEAVDLGEVFDSYAAGKLDASDQKKIAPMLDELQSLLRDGNERRMKQLVNAILDIEPGQPTALRIRLFVLENNGRPKEAWELLESQLEKAPQLKRLYFMALDLAGRNPELSGEAGKIARKYIATVTDDADSDNLMAWTLLVRRPEDPEALKAARDLIARSAAKLEKAAPATAGASWNTRALYACRTGRLDEAILYQGRALEAFRKSDLPAAVEDAKRKQEYYVTALELGKGK